MPQQSSGLLAPVVAGLLGGLQGIRLLDCLKIRVRGRWQIETRDWKAKSSNTALSNLHEILWSPSEISSCRLNFCPWEN